MLRDLNIGDLVILEKDAKFPLPPLADASYIVKKSIINKNNELIGSFWVKITSEVSLILSSDVSHLTKARAVKEIDKFLREEMIKHGINDMHIFIKNDADFTDFLVRHLNLKELWEDVLYDSYRRLSHG